MSYNVKGNNTVISSPYDSSYGLANVVFNSPAQSFSTALQAMQPTEYKVTACAPSESDSNADCLPGSPLYNLQMSKPILASKLTTTTTKAPVAAAPSR
jgi:hypothetical protein